VLTKYESMKIPTVLWLQCSQHRDELALTDHALRWTSIEASTDASIGASTTEAQRGPIRCKPRLLQLQVASCTVFYHHAAVRCRQWYLQLGLRSSSRLGRQSAL
jgi:hypothetical protein